MKKIIFSLVAIIAATFSVSAINLKDAFTALSNIQNVNVVTPDYNFPITADVVKEGQISAAYNLNRQQILESGNAALTILNQVPLAYMINGGNNNNVGAFIYTTPAGENSNEILIAVMSGFRGSLVFMYGTIDDASRDALQNAPLQMEGNFLSIEASMPDGSEFNIIQSKAR